MDPDLIMAIGLVLAVLTIPSIMSAFSEGRSLRATAVTILIAGGMILWAIWANPGGYSFTELPELLIRVIARFLT